MNRIQQLKDDLIKLFQIDSSWLGLLNKHGWSITLEKLISFSNEEFEKELIESELEVDRNSRGFSGFDSNSISLVVPGKPQSSLLYHTLASPLVVQDVKGFEIKEYPSLALIEDLENYIFSIRKSSINGILKITKKELGLDENASLELAIGTFSVEYRPKSSTVHLVHDDLCFSRTGVARVGNKEPLYIPKLRGFKVFDEKSDNKNDIRVLPCRFSTYLAVKLKGIKNKFGPANRLSKTDNDDQLDFWVPIHKLFSGDDCIDGLTLNVNIEKKHYNQKLEKLGKLFKSQGLTSVSESEFEAPPFRVTKNLSFWGNTEEFGDGLLIPQPNPITTLTKKNGLAVGFNAPNMERMNPPFSDSFSPTLSMNLEGTRNRPYPEYVHVREKIDSDGSTINLSDDPNIIEKAKNGEYLAAHLSDFAGDGWVKSTVTDGNNKELTHEDKILKSISAYSLLSAPDFMPKVRQRQVYEWWKSIPDKKQELPKWWQWILDNGFWDLIWRADPRPLSDERLRANLQLPDTEFSSDDQGSTAIVSMLQNISVLGEANILGKFPNLVKSTSLPDGAAGFFAPGWDTSIDSESGNEHLAAYGLGSPFPEDAKLCAALSTFWPAAAPDTNRTFFDVPFTRNGSVAPLTDAEMGVGESSLAWDGIKGPEVIESNGNNITIDYPDYERADYSRVALNNGLSIALTSQITLEEYKRRILAMLRCYRSVGTINQKGESHIVSFTKLSGNESFLEEAQEATSIELTGPIYRIFGFNKTFNNQNNILEDKNILPSKQRRQIKVRVSWSVLVGTGDNVLIQLSRGDGSIAKSNWTALDF